MEVLIKVNNSDPVIYSPSLGVGDGCDWREMMMRVCFLSWLLFLATCKYEQMRFGFSQLLTRRAFRLKVTFLSALIIGALAAAFVVGLCTACRRCSLLLRGKVPIARIYFTFHEEFLIIQQLTSSFAPFPPPPPPPPDPLPLAIAHKCIRKTVRVEWMSF